jgi:putative ABC transport system substrate-binding protein
MADVSVDPVSAGLVDSYARPGGNVTGLARISAELVGKRLELLKGAVPAISRVAVLWGRTVEDKVAEFEETERAAQALGVRLQSLGVRNAGDFDPVFASAIREQAEALFVLYDGFLGSHEARILDFVAQNRLPSMFDRSWFVAAGGLMSYGVSTNAQWRRAAYYVDRILKGTPPADLPVERPMRFELVVNMKTAQALGITFPNEIMLQVTEVIQ